MDEQDSSDLIRAAAVRGDAPGPAPNPDPKPDPSPDPDPSPNRYVVRSGDTAGSDSISYSVLHGRVGC